MPYERISGFEAGVPTVADIERVRETDLFTALETSSDAFLSHHTALLAPYSKRWVTDPLHQWSRRWEYPFVLHGLRAAERGDDGELVVLDAGSGLTFYPFHVARAIQGARVVCVDNDARLEGLFRSVNAVEDVPVEFRTGDLHDIPVADGSMRAAYSISVLEHTSGFDRIVQELRRVLAPNGVLAVTFDISLDGNADIPVDEAEALLGTLAANFDVIDAPDDVAGQLGRAGVLTTDTAAAEDPTLLPWRHPFLSAAKAAVRRRKLPLTRRKRLACCGALYRRA
jgi:SAM-dependent methyltransferase